VNYQALWGFLLFIDLPLSCVLNTWFYVSLKCSSFLNLMNSKLSMVTSLKNKLHLWTKKQKTNFLLQEDSDAWPL
jgi:hypothetical protein